MVSGQQGPGSAPVVQARAGGLLGCAVRGGSLAGCLGSAHHIQPRPARQQTHPALALHLLPLSARLLAQRPRLPLLPADTVSGFVNDVGGAVSLECDAAGKCTVKMNLSVISSIGAVCGQCMTEA